LIREIVRSVLNIIEIATLVDWWSTKDSSDLHVVSATDESHFRSAMQLVDSIVKNCPQASFVLYDLGLTEESRSQLLQRGVNLKEFKFSNYPEFFQMHTNHGSYAWKPVIIQLEALMSNKQTLVWLDAGCKVGARFSGFDRLVRRHKIFANPSASTYENWLHPSAAVAYVDASILRAEQIKSLSEEVMLSAAFLGFDLKDKRVRGVLESWAHCAHSKEIIGPHGSSTQNHRFDQVLLDALIRKSNSPHFPYARAWLPAVLVGVKTHMDVEALT